jgi:hypothetical protein
MKLSPLELAWLEELGMFEQLPELPRADQVQLKKRASAAASRVRENFSRLVRNGDLREVTQAYKLHRETEKKPLSWSAFSVREQENMIREYAKEQKLRAERGEKVE